MKVLRIGKSVEGWTKGKTYEAFYIGRNTFRTINDLGSLVTPWWDLDIWELIEEEEEMKEMQLSELKAGMRFETRNGEQGLVFVNKRGNTCLLFQTGKVIGNISLYGLEHDYTHEMLYRRGEDQRYLPALDIMKVWKAYMVYQHCDLSKKPDVRPIGERKEVKELTVEEIEKLLGYGVKVVNSANN